MEIITFGGRYTLPKKAGQGRKQRSLGKDDIIILRAVANAKGGRLPNAKDLDTNGMFNTITEAGKKGILDVLVRHKLIEHTGRKGCYKILPAGLDVLANHDSDSSEERLFSP